MAASPAIEVENLCKTYGPIVAVDQVNFRVAPGELVGFLGPNGAGKSTTMRILTSYLPATSGYARINGFDVMTESMQVRQNIGYLPESVPLYGEMRVEEYLHYRAKLKGVDRRKRAARIDYCVNHCRIREVQRRLLSTLSKGYRQRVGLADALLADPKILILDEPTAGLDPVQIRETLNTIRELAGSHTILLSTHILSEVEAICERVIIINKGGIKWDGKLSSFAEQVPVLSLEVRGPAREVSAMLEREEGVRQVKAQTLEDQVTLFEVTAEKNRDLRESLAQKIVKAGWGLRRLEMRRPKLEDLFLRVVHRNELVDDWKTS